MVCDALERRGCERAPRQDPDIAQEYWLTPGGKEFQVPKRPPEFPDWMTHDILTDVARLGGLNPFAHSGRD
ncbi:MAG: hypothetical protein HQL41_06625 [Alphaproteobacteria bacterium]|nr:hypothetical protein [Alphaproteobacteria bacterium]